MASAMAMGTESVATAQEKPLLRGVSHQISFFCALAATGVLVARAAPGAATGAALIFGFSLVTLFGTSALYHRISWASQAARRWMRRLDHSMIFLLIAGTYTPFAVLALHGPLSTAILVVVWAAAAAGIVLKLVWIDAPKWLVALIYIAIGWVALAAFPQLLSRLGVTATAMVAAGGALYTLGAIVYARRRPDPAPTVFGYHEIFHALVILAAALQYAVVAFWVLPGS